MQVRVLVHQLPERRRIYPQELEVGLGDDARSTGPTLDEVVCVQTLVTDSVHPGCGTYSPASTQVRLVNWASKRYHWLEYTGGKLLEPERAHQW
jgi:hypothetical protein